MRWVTVALALCLLALAPEAAARTHVVASGHTLGKIARRYNVSIDELCKANGIQRRDPLKIGQKLTIPVPGSAGAEAPSKPVQPAAQDPATRRIGSDGMMVIDVPRVGPAYYYEPIGPGRHALKPVLVYLHGRGGRPQTDCRRWAPVARRIGWLVCPAGPGPQGQGRGWNNNWVTGQRAAIGSVQALREKYGRRVQLWGNTLIGFSEGAYVAMNVGVRAPRTFNRWLILAADNDYWGGPGLQELKKSGTALKRVYLITGEQDGVIGALEQVRGWLKDAGVQTQVSTPKDMGHEVALERKQAMYRAALVWLDRGSETGPKPHKQVARRER
jgi:murein DD-endopeptidase MepM/ murein hydrolase activator NlpD